MRPFSSRLNRWFRRLPRAGAGGAAGLPLLVCLGALGLGALATTPTAQAQTADGTAAKFSKADFTIAFRDKDDKYVTGTALDTFFNRVNCGCAAPVTVEVRLNAASRSKFDSTLVYDSKLRAGDDSCVCVGASCSTVNCKDISETQNAAVLLNGPLLFKTTVRDLFEAGLPAGSDVSTACDRDQAQSLWFWMDNNGDSDSSTDITDVTLQVQLDGKGPPAPTGVTVTPGNQALAVSWTSLTTQSDLQGYQVLCSRGENLAPFKGVFSPAFTTKSNQCATTTATLTGTATGALTGTLTGDLSVTSAALAVRGTPPAALAALNPDFLCSELLPNQTSARLFRLQNDINYVVGVIAIDKRGNPSALTEVVSDAPKATQDFFTGYRSDGGVSEGGCSMGRPSNRGRGFGIGGGILFGIAGATLVGRRQRARRQGGAQ